MKVLGYFINTDWPVFGFGMACLALAAFLAFVVIPWVAGRGERRRVAERRRATELRIDEIGRQAEAAIISEALRRMRQPGGSHTIDGEWS